MDIITYFQTLAFWQVIVLIIVLFIIYVIYEHVSKDRYTIDIISDYNNYYNRLERYIMDELLVVENISTQRASEILSNTDIAVNSSKYIELGIFRIVLHQVLYEVILRDIINVITTEMLQNHILGEEELEYHVYEMANKLLNLSRQHIQSKEFLFPNLVGSDDKRFTLRESIDLYRKVVIKAQDLIINHKKNVQDIKKRYSILYAFKVFDNLVDTLKKI